MEDTNPNYTALVTMGYVPDVAEALDEQGVTAEQARLLSATEVLEHYLNYEGIIGYTSSIIEALDCAREVQARRARACP